MSLLELLVKPAHRRLLDVVTRLPHLGVGSRVTRKAWEQHGDSYWEVTRVKARNEDGTAGRVWGVLTWRGEREARERQINGRAKRVWRWVPGEHDAARLRPLVEEWRRASARQGLHAAQLAKQQQGAAGGGGS